MTEQSNLDRLLEIAQQLSPEERDQLLRTGVVMPAVTKADLEGRHRWGYRCKYCGGMALYFVGQQFSDGSGTLLDKPPLSLPVHQIPFTQPDLHPSRQNRSAPLCQCCGQIVVLSRGYLIEKYIHEIETWKAARHAGYEALKRYRSSKDRSQATHNTDGSPINMAQHYDKSEDAQLKETRERQEAETPGITAAVEEVAAKFDLLGHLAAGPSGKRGKK